MKNKIDRPKFFAKYKDFNNGYIKNFDVLETIFDKILTPGGKINTKEFYIFNKDLKRVRVTTKEQLREFVEDNLRYYYWAKCEWEFVVVDWPYRDEVDKSRPIKIDVFDQLEPNLPVITDLVWNYIKEIDPKLQ